METTARTLMEPIAAKLEKELKAMRYTAHTVRVREIDDDLALAVWYVDFNYKPFFMPAKGESFKANAIFRRTDEGWRFIHYAEAPMSAIMYFERLYRDQASPDFVEATANPPMRAPREGDGR